MKNTQKESFFVTHMLLCFCEFVKFDGEFVKFVWKRGFFDGLKRFRKFSHFSSLHLKLKVGFPRNLRKISLSNDATQFYL